MTDFRPLSEYPNAAFSSCGSCRRCCDASAFFLAPLVLEDFVSVAGHFPILFVRLNDAWRAVIPLSTPKGGCPYLGETGCRIYAERPPACRLYPLSPYRGETLLDLSCPAVGHEGLNLHAEHATQGLFWHPRVKNLDDKAAQTALWLERQRFILVAVSRGLSFFRLEAAQDEAGRLHQKSLDLLTRFELV